MNAKIALPKNGDDVPSVVQAECNDHLHFGQISNFVEGKPLKNVKSKTEPTNNNTDDVRLATSSKACSFRCKGSDSKELEKKRRGSASTANAAGSCTRSQCKGFTGTIKEYKMDTSSGVPELIQEAYNAKGRLIWRKIMIGRRLGINSNNCLAKASSSPPEGCSTLSGSFSEEDAMRDVAPIFDVTVAVKASAKQESFKRASHQQAFGTKTKVEAADQEEKAKNPKAIVSVGTRGGVSAASSALTAQPNVKKGGITQSVLKFLGKLEDATIKSNRMREKNILGSHYELIKICLISQGFLVAAFVLVAIVSVNVAALLFIVVLFASR